MPEGISSQWPREGNIEFKYLAPESSDAVKTSLGYSTMIRQKQFGPNSYTRTSLKRHHFRHLNI
jgi:hypothetical protein